MCDDLASHMLSIIGSQWIGAFRASGTRRHLWFRLLRIVNLPFLAMIAGVPITLAIGSGYPAGAILFVSFLTAFAWSAVIARRSGHHGLAIPALLLLMLNTLGAGLAIGVSVGCITNVYYD